MIKNNAFISLTLFQETTSSYCINFAIYNYKNVLIYQRQIIHLLHVKFVVESPTSTLSGVCTVVAKIIG